MLQEPQFPSRRLGLRQPSGSLKAGALATLACLLVTGCASSENGAVQAGTGEGCDFAANYPDGPVEIVVPWAAGGGSDSVARVIGKELAAEMETDVNVVNEIGGGGVGGHTEISNAEPDGSKIGMITVEITQLHWLGLTDLTHTGFAPIGQANADPGGIVVSEDAPWNDAAELIDAIEADPGSIIASGTGRGGIWDLARAGMLVEVGLEADDLTWVPSEGSAPAIKELLGGGVDVVLSSLVENRALLEEGRIKAIGIMAAERDPNFPDVPTLSELGIDFEIEAWRGFAGPAGMDEKITSELECHLEAVVNGDAYKDFMGTSGFGIKWRDANEFGQFMEEEDTRKGEIMKAAGLAQ